jgi:hypothetical protein
MLVPVNFRSNRRQFDANLDEISKEPRSVGAKLRAVRSASLMGDGVGGAASASARATRVGQQRSGAGEGSQTEVEEGQVVGEKEIFVGPT